MYYNRGHFHIKPLGAHILDKPSGDTQNKYVTTGDTYVPNHTSGDKYVTIGGTFILNYLGHTLLINLAETHKATVTTGDTYVPNHTSGDMCYNRGHFHIILLRANTTNIWDNWGHALHTSVNKLTSGDIWKILSQVGKHKIFVTLGA